MVLASTRWIVPSYLELAASVVSRRLGQMLGRCSQEHSYSVITSCACATRPKSVSFLVCTMALHHMNCC